MASTDAKDTASANPARVQSSTELAGALNTLRGRRTYADLGKAARALAGGSGTARLPSSTLSDLLLKGRCERQTLETFLAVCGVPRDQHERWLAAWERTRTATAPVPGAVRVRGAGWRSLGVHVPIEVPGAHPDTLPTYVPRDIDEQPGTGLRPWLRVAAGRGGMVVLVGGSCAGKTRCLLTAVQQVLPDWWLLHPRDAAQLTELADRPPGRLVIWLDELQSYLNGADGLTAANASRLIQAGAVIVATIWPAYHDTFLAAPGPALHRTDPADAVSGTASAGQSDRYQVERQLLKLAHRIHLAERCSPAETDRARHLADTAHGGTGDPWLQAALRSCDPGLTQIIAAAPQLLDRWRNGTPYARAILAVAADAARLGVHSPLAVEFMRAAAPGYCTPAQQAQAPANWFEAALDYATQPLAGAAAALTPVGDGMTMGATTGYRMADFLDQRARTDRADQIPPHSFWTAAAVHTHPTDLHRLGAAAWNRGLYRHAAQLWKNATKHGHPAAAANLVTRLHRLHPTDPRPAHYTAAHAALDNSRDLGNLLYALRTVGAKTQAAELLARDPAVHVALDNAFGVAALLGELREAGADGQVAALAKRTATRLALDDPSAVVTVLEVLKEVGAEEDIAVLLARDPAAHVALDNEYGVVTLVHMLREVGASGPASALVERTAASPLVLASPLYLGVLLHELRVETPDLAAALAERVVAHPPLNYPRRVADMVTVLWNEGANVQVAALVERIATQVALDDAYGVADLLEALRPVAAADQIAALAKRAAARVALDDPSGVMALVGRLREVGADEQVAALVERAAAHVALDDPSSVVAGLDVLQSAGADEQVAALVEGAAAHVALNDPSGVAALLEVLRKGGARNQVVVLLARDPGVHVALDNAFGVAALLGELREAGADGQVAALAKRAAAHLTVDDPRGVAAVLGELREARRDGQVAALAKRATAELALHRPHEVAALLPALHEAGAATQAAALAERLPAAGMFAQFAEVGDRAERFRYGRGRDGSAAAHWSWEDLQ